MTPESVEDMQKDSDWPLHQCMKCGGIVTHQEAMICLRCSTEFCDACARVHKCGDNEQYVTKVKRLP